MLIWLSNILNLRNCRYALITYAAAVASDDNVNNLNAIITS